MSMIPNWLAGRRVLVAGAGLAADATVEAFARAGAVTHRSSAGLTDAPEIAAAFTAAVEALGGPVDILVHGGATLSEAESVALDLDAWRTGFSADLDGRFLHAAEFARRSIEAKAPGAVLFLMPDPKIAPGRAAAATAQGALDNLVKSLAVEWARDGIRVNAIASRVVERYAAASPEQQASLTALAAYICSDYGAYITGSTMGIDET